MNLTTGNLASDLLTVAQIIDQIYYRLDTLQADCDASGIEMELIENKETDTQVYLFARDNQIDIIIPGTQTKRDWCTDLQCPYTVWRGPGLVHGGFANACESVFNPLLRSLQTRLTTKSAVTFGGHSLGAALAPMLAQALLGIVVPKAVYALEPPRWCGSIRADNYDQDLKSVTWRTENQGDMVPYVPLGIWGYRQVGQCITFADDGSVTLDKPQPFQFSPSELCQLFDGSHPWFQKGNTSICPEAHQIQTMERLFTTWIARHAQFAK